MNKISGVARRILGWKLNRWDRWYDFEKRKFIPDTDFQPEENINHAMLHRRSVGAMRLYLYNKKSNRSSFQ